MNSVLVGSVASNLALCVICGVSMSNVFQLLNTIQVISMIPLLKIPVPPQFINFCQLINEFANLEILPEEVSIKNIKNQITGEEASADKRMLEEVK